MAFPEPKPGLVIRYAFLWSHEADAGALEATKDRPCAIVVAAHRGEGGEVQVIVAPITHAPPTDATASIEIPPAACRSLGLDQGRHWLRADELNRFTWPGYDLREVPGRKDQYAYGMLAPRLYQQLRSAILSRQKARVQRRD